MLNKRLKQRTAEIQQLAHHLNYDFQEKETFNSLPLLKDFALFKRGFGKKITNVLHHNDEWNQIDNKIFDYKFAISTGNSTRIFRQTVFFIQSKKLGLPNFWLKPEKFFHRIGNYLGLTQDIDFEEFPEFSKNYLLQGEDEELTRYIMNNELLQFFSLNKGWYIEGINYYLIIYKWNTLFAPIHIEELIRNGKSIFEMLKEDL